MRAVFLPWFTSPQAPPAAARAVKRCEPSRHLHQGAPYTNAASTDIRVLFERVRAQLKAAAELPQPARPRRVK